MSTTDKTERRPRRFLTFAQVCERFEVSERTPSNWARRGYITPYRANDGTLLLDVDEIETALKFYGPTKMRDGRTRYGQTVRPLPVEVVE